MGLNGPQEEEEHMLWKGRTEVRRVVWSSSRSWFRDASRCITCTVLGLILAYCTLASSCLLAFRIQTLGVV